MLHISGDGVDAGVPGKRKQERLSRDWVAKGQRLLGVSAVIAESFERIHRSNLLMFWVAPLILDAASMERLKASINSDSVVTVDLQHDERPVRLRVRIYVSNALRQQEFEAFLRTDTEYEYRLLAAGGLLASLQLV